VWDSVKGKDIPVRLGLCIIHGAMRTMESCLRLLLESIGEKFLNEVTLNGNEVRSLYKDCISEKPVLIDAVRETCTALRPRLVRLAVVVDIPIALRPVRVVDVDLPGGDGGLPKAK